MNTGKQTELLNVSDEKKALKKAIIEIDAELKDLKFQQLKQSKCLFECKTCDFKGENYDLLKRHNLQNHSHHKGCQYENYENFEPYNCFYCERRIISLDNLEDHYMTCQNEFGVMIEPPDTYQEEEIFLCEYCDAKCEDTEDLKRHRTTYHCVEFVNDEFEPELFQCDICPLYYMKKIDLDFHKRGCHWDHL